MFESFRQELDRVEADGNTAVYDALEKGRTILANYRRDLPNLRKRIIIISDGDDTSSSTSAHTVCRALSRDKIIVDSVQVGTQHNGILHAISVTTGKIFSPFVPAIISHVSPS